MCLFWLLISFQQFRDLSYTAGSNSRFNAANHNVLQTFMDQGGAIREKVSVFLSTESLMLTLSFWRVKTCYLLDLCVCIRNPGMVFCSGHYENDTWICHVLDLGYFISVFSGVSESSWSGLEQMNFSSTRGKTVAGREIFEQTKQRAFYFALGVYVVDIMCI